MAASESPRLSKGQIGRTGHGRVCAHPALSETGMRHQWSLILPAHLPFAGLHSKLPALTQSHGTACSRSLVCRWERRPGEVVEVTRGHLAKWQHRDSNANRLTLEHCSSPCRPSLCTLSHMHTCISARACAHTHVHLVPRPPFERTFPPV